MPETTLHRYANATYADKGDGTSVQSNAVQTKISETIHGDGKTIAAKRGVYLFERNNGEFVIAHRGTVPTNKEDLKADASIASGKIHRNELFRDRATITRQFAEQAKSIASEKGRDARIHYTGHSLGGSTVTYALHTSENLGDTFGEAHVYNMGSTPTQGRFKYKRKADYGRNGITHHHVRGDVISAHGGRNFGVKQVNYRPRFSLTVAASRLVNPFLGSTANQLHRHTIDRFKDDMSTR